jgi:hypothetical protein
VLFDKETVSAVVSEETITTEKIKNTIPRINSEIKNPIIDASKYLKNCFINCSLLLIIGCKLRKKITYFNNC